MSVINEVGVLELQQYIEAYYMLPRIKEEKESVIESLYDDCVPSTRFYDPNMDQWLKNGVNTEDMAILIIERKEEYDRMIKRYEYKAELFESALESLTPREKDVINIRYFGKPNDIGLTLEYFHKTLQQAEKKLCSSICIVDREKKVKWNAEMKAARKQKVKEWRQAN